MRGGLHTHCLPKTKHSADCETHAWDASAPTLIRATAPDDGYASSVQAAASRSRRRSRSRERTTYVVTGVQVVCQDSGRLRFGAAC